ncbi:MAG: GDP-mannose 4,6-dehydratase [Chloroflexi bacterium SZAS-1]|nr:GDP-mannose 4,6-dehydratase [Chloroflexi bacterium SZAS-1]
MRALITGINGFVGGYLAEHLLAEGEWELWGMARQPELALPQLRGAVRPLIADLGDQPAVVAALAAAQPDVIFHLAAQSNVPRSFEDPAGTLTTNLVAQLNLFQAVLQLKLDPLLVIATSNEIYGHIQPEDLPLSERTPFRPVNPYSVSKAAQDLLAYQYYASHKLRTLRLRLFNHIGPRQTEQFAVGSFAAQIARIEAGLQAPCIRVGNLAAERDFTDVRDIVRAYSLAAQRGRVPCAYNIGSGHSVSLRHLLDILLALSPRTIAVEPDPTRMRPADVPRVVSDYALFHSHTGWAPRIPLEQTLADVLDYWRQRAAQRDFQGAH